MEWHRIYQWYSNADPMLSSNWPRKIRLHGVLRGGGRGFIYLVWFWIFSKMKKKCEFWWVENEEECLEDGNCNIWKSQRINKKTRNPFFFKLFSWIFCPIDANIVNTPIEQLHSVAQDERKKQKDEGKVRQGILIGMRVGVIWHQFS